MTLFLIASSIALLVLTTNFLPSNAETFNFSANSAERGVISIVFNDGLQGQFDNAFPLMNARGINATFYVATDLLRESTNNSSFMDINELKTLQASGSEIGSHGKTHSADFTTLSDDQIREECNLSKQFLQSNGFSVNNFAFPYGNTNDHINSIISQYYRSGRTAYSDSHIMPFPYTKFNLTSYDAETGGSSVLNDLRSLVDNVTAEKGWVIVFFHNVVPIKNISPWIDTSTYDFANFLDYVVSKEVLTLTVNQALDLAFSLSPSPSLSPTPTLSPSPTLTPIPTLTPSPSPTLHPSSTPTPTLSPSPTPTLTPSPTPTPTLSPSPTPTASALTSPSLSPSSLSSPSPSIVEHNSDFSFIYALIIIIAVIAIIAASILLVRRRKKFPD